MKHRACQLYLILATAAAPAAWAGTDILKCVDRGGHVTLTDQPCPAGSAVEKVLVPDAGGGSYGGSGAAGSTGAGADEAAGTPAMPAMEHFPAPPPAPRARLRQPAARRALSRDAATLKAARAQMLLRDEGQARQRRLAGLD
jgi:hypothetical protein